MQSCTNCLRGSQRLRDRKRMKGRCCGGETKGDGGVQEEGVNSVYWCHRPGGSLKRATDLAFKWLLMNERWGSRVVFHRNFSCLVVKRKYCISLRRQNTGKVGGFEDERKFDHVGRWTVGSLWGQGDKKGILYKVSFGRGSKGWDQELRERFFGVKTH